MRPLPALFLLFLALPAAAQTTTISTRCQVADVQVRVDFTAVRLLGCGEGFSSDVLWNLDRIDSPSGALDNRFTRHSRPGNAIVYVMDTGVEQNHDEFQRATGPNVIAGIDAVKLSGGSFPSCNGDASIHPCLEGPVGVLAVVTHGTGVASVVAGRTVGVTPDAQIVSVLCQGGPNTWLAALNAIIQHAWDPTTPQFRTAVINISGGLGFQANEAAQRAQLDQKIRDMVGGVDAEGRPDSNGKRFLFVSAAGNRADPTKPGGDQGQCDPNGDMHIYPASLGPSIEGVIAVGGMTIRNEFWSGSCNGSEILAPAENVLVASNSGPDYYRKIDPSGTSWSTPIVSGVAAQMLLIEPDLTPAELERRILSTPSFINDTQPEHAGGRVVTLFTTPRRRLTR